MKNLKARIDALYTAQGDLDEEIEIVLDLTETLFLDNRFDLVDELLMTLDAYRLGPLSLEGILRSTYRFQHALPNWEYFLGEAKTVMNSMGHDPEMFLAGLEAYPTAASERNIPDIPKSA